jgi:hypothetical protein
LARRSCARRDEPPGLAAWLPFGRGRSPVSCQRAAGDAPEEVVDELQENLEDEQYESPAAVMAGLGD